MEGDTKDRLRDFARNLLASAIAHRLRITVATARRNYVKPDEEPDMVWFRLAEGLERQMLLAAEAILDGPEKPAMSSRPN